jgi:antitoxin CcdA
MGKAELKIQIDAALLDDARAAGVQIELVMEEAVRTALSSRTDSSAADARAARWAEENAEAIADYNRRILERGVFSDGLRTW